MVSGNIDLLSFTWLGLLVLRVIAARHFAQAIFDKLNGVFVFDDKVSQHQIRLLTRPAPDILEVPDSAPDPARRLHVQVQYGQSGQLWTLLYHPMRLFL